VIAGERVAIALAQVGVVVSQIEREDLVGERQAGIPVRIALIRNAGRECATVVWVEITKAGLHALAERPGSGFTGQ
jgi:hypothetical protein